MIFIDKNDYSCYRRYSNKKNNPVLDAIVSVRVRLCRSYKTTLPIRHYTNIVVPAVPLLLCNQVP